MSDRYHCGALCLLAGLILYGTGARAQVATTFLSANLSGVEGNQNSQLPCTNADGRFVAFVSRADNLVPGDSNTVDDIFLRDLETGALSRISVATDGTQADKRSDTPSMAADGRYIVFQSDATTLVAGKASGIYLRDVQTSQTTYVAPGTNPVISADGGLIAFVSKDALLPTDTNLVADVYAVERATGQLSLISVTSDGTVGDKASGVGGIALSTDGSIVAFQSVAQNLAPGISNTDGNVFVRDRNAGKTERVSLTYDGFQAEKGSSAPAISGDGNLVAFESVATDLIARDTNDSYDVFVRDRAAKTTVRVSLNADGGEISMDSRHAVFSADGRYLAFESEAADVVAFDANNAMDIFVRDLEGGTTERVSLNRAGGEVDGHSYDTALSRDGRYVAFTSEGKNLTPGISGNVNNVFARGLPVAVPGQLAFTTEPAGASAGVAFTTQPVVEVRNMDGSRRWDYDGPITILITPGTGREGAVLSGTTEVNAVHGIATFASLSLDLAGTGYELQAIGEMMLPGTTAPFDVKQTPAKVVVTVQPAGASAGLAFATQPQVEVRDVEDNLVSWYAGTATVSIKPGTGRAGGALGGMLSAPITGGTATFTDLSLNLAGPGYVLVVSADDLAPGETAAFTVAQTATKVVFVVQPGGAAAGKAFSTQPVVQVRDAEDNIAHNFTGPVTVAIKAGTGRAGAALSGTTTVNAVAGVASFTDLSLDLAGSGYVLSASSGALATGDSAAFTVAQTPTKLAYALQPGGAVSRSPFAVQPIVLVRDSEDKLVPDYTGPVTISIKPGTGRAGASLSGATTINAASGVASFTDLAIDFPGTGYVLVASSGTLAAAESAPFAVAQPPYVFTDVSRALRLAGGLAAASAYDVVIYDVVTDGASSGRIDVPDAARLARKVAGLE